MKEIVTDEFIRYKDGFITGKYEIVDAFALGKIINLNQVDTDENEDNNDTWFSYGVEDGFKYFANLIDQNNLDLANISTREIVKECFTKRVLEINQEQGKEVPVSKFKL